MIMLSKLSFQALLTMNLYQNIFQGIIPCPSWLPVGAGNQSRAPNSWLSLAGVGNLPGLHGFLALRTQSSSPPFPSKNPSCPAAMVPTCKRANGHALHLHHAMENSAEIPQQAENRQAKSLQGFSMGRAKSDAIHTCH